MVADLVLQETDHFRSSDTQDVTDAIKTVPATINFCMMLERRCGHVVRVLAAGIEGPRFKTQLNISCSHGSN